MRHTRAMIIEEPEFVKSILLTVYSASIMKEIIKKGTITTVQLSEFKKISIQNASSQLRNLFYKGYLERKQFVPETGGVEYIYKSI